MKQKAAQSWTPGLAKKQVSSGELSRQGSRYSSGSDDFNLPHSQAQPDRAPFPTAPGQTNHDVLGMGNNAGHDDSGIGIRTPDEDFQMEKFSFSQADNHELMVDADLAA